VVPRASRHRVGECVVSAQRPVTGLAVEVGLGDRLAAGVLSGGELLELAAVLELAAAALRAIAECSEEQQERSVPRDIAVLLDALGMTRAELSTAEWAAVVWLAADERGMVSRLAGLIRRSRVRGDSDG